MVWGLRSISLLVIFVGGQLGILVTDDGHYWVHTVEATWSKQAGYIQPTMTLCYCLGNTEADIPRTLLQIRLLEPILHKNRLGPSCMCYSIN